MIKVAVIAGTPVDTQMGVDYLEKKNAEYELPVVYPVSMPVSSSCDEQLKFQYSDDAAKHKRMDEIFDKAMQEGIRDFFIYCNSLSGAFDFESYKEEKGVRIYTPLQVYRALGKQYHCLGVVAANNLSTYNIEKTLMESNDSIYMIGSGNMNMVSCIEQHLPPAEIVERCGVDHLAGYFEANGCECFLLGCTHFPYLKSEIAKVTRLPIIDPADEMFESLLAGAEEDQQ